MSRVVFKVTPCQAGPSTHGCWGHVTGAVSVVVSFGLITSRWLAPWHSLRASGGTGSCLVLVERVPGARTVPGPSIYACSAHRLSCYQLHSAGSSLNTLEVFHDCSSCRRSRSQPCALLCPSSWEFGDGDVGPLRLAADHPEDESLSKPLQSPPNLPSCKGGRLVWELPQRNVTLNLELSTQWYRSRERPVSCCRERIRRPSKRFSGSLVDLNGDKLLRCPRT